MSKHPPRNKRLLDDSREDQRNAFQRDRDRVLYTTEFRRLSGITQVARAEESYTYHDRLSHSLKVAQIGRRLAEYLPSRKETTLSDQTEVNKDVVETAALAHDLGHPPFGHVAEKELDAKLRNEKDVQEGFEGNAQSFRIVVNLAAHNDADQGLNLTLASLNAILKYPWVRADSTSGKNRWDVNESKKWGAYETERDALERARSLSVSNKRKSPEADIMDWADDLAYAVHDLEDFYRAGILPLEQLLTRDSKEQKSFLNHTESKHDILYSDGQEILSWVRNQGGDELMSSFEGSQEERTALDYLSSTLIRRYIGREKGGLYLQDSDPDDPYLQVNEELNREVKLLKSMTVYYVISDPALRAQQRGQKKIVGELFDILYNAIDPAGNEDLQLVPSPFKERIDDIDSPSKREISQIAVDTVTSMTEKQTVELYERLMGSSPGSIREQITY